MLVSNTGPLVALGILEKVDILPRIYQRIFVTESVKEEITRSATKPGADLFETVDWIRVVPDPTMPDSWLMSLLDPGEATTIALAKREGADHVLIDERKGRRVAREIYKLPVIGTCGVLVEAKRNGILQSVKPLLIQLRETGYHLHSSLIEEIAASVGE